VAETDSDQPVYRHGPQKPWEAPQGEVCLEQISAHIEKHLGKVESVFHEIISDAVHIDVHFVLPTEAFPYARLVTSGMSDLPMGIPPEISKSAKHLELLLTLPGDWKLDQDSFDDERWYWPVRLIKYLARMPHKHNTWLGWGHSIPNGDPAESYAAGTAWNGAVILPSVTVPEAFHTLKIDEEKTIRFYAVVPLYPEEMDLKLRSGTEELMKRFGRADITDIVQPGRKNVGRKFLGLF
jgi:hypothetical protein